MRLLSINLATHPFRNNRAVASVLSGAAAFIVLATAANLYVFLSYRDGYAELQTEQRDARARLARLQREEKRLALEVQERDFESLYERGRFAGELILRQAFSWTLLFNKLEELMPPEVMMAAIRPNITGEGIVIRVDGVAKNHGALLTLEERLMESPLFDRVYPGSVRKMNPRRPDYSFTLRFDYLPHRASPPAAVVAAGPAPAAPAGGPALPAPERDSAAPAAASSAPRGAALGTAGRDLRTRTPEALARIMVAPGGLYVPPGAPRPAGARPEEDEGRGDPEPNARRPRSPSHGDPPGPQGVGPAGPGAGAGDGAPTPAPQRAPKGRPPRLPGRAGRAPGRDAPQVKARPARRLDVSLSFASTPVNEVYRALERAHAVTFRLDPGVDRDAPVSANLSGRTLQEAIAAVSALAGHRVTRVGEGVYRVVAISGGVPMRDEPVGEEDLPGMDGTR
ncbi:MAG: PilN domain-containing protein [Acidobacteriota bacterium]